ncbi:MAG: winged helix-turn-helix transcriptional regulator [Nitrospirota bacterium]
MNNKPLPEPESHKTLKILNEISDNGSMTQRDLSSKLGIALGLVNSYIKNLIAKGYITVKSIPPRRYAYYLTPKGFAEKTRLTIHLLQDYTRIFHDARSALKKLFNELQASGAKKVVFAGADEVAEIAYISLHETDLELAGIVDDEKAGKKFFGIDIRPLKDINSMIHDSIVITSFVKRQKIYKELLEHEIPGEDIKTIFDL